MRFLTLTVCSGVWCLILAVWSGIRCFIPDMWYGIERRVMHNGVSENLLKCVKTTLHIDNLAKECGKHLRWEKGTKM